MYAAEEQYIISDEARKAITKCHKGMSCLNKDRKDLCKIKYTVGHSVYFISCLAKKPCLYQKHFGNGQFCTCPIRKELYDRHGI